jgi:5-(carboxyamino)imidazole ribonucleotide synthase
MSRPTSVQHLTASLPALLPGCMLGVLGGGQLGAMFAMAARRMGYRVAVFSDTAEAPAARHADRLHVVDYADGGRLAEIARDIDAMTFEFENVPASAAREVAAVTRVHPSPEVLFTTQNRGREKAFLVRNGFDCGPHRLVGSAAELRQAVADLGLPVVLKTASFGYDGRGQLRLTDESQLESAWESLGGEQLIVEAWIDFEMEISVVVARGADGSVVSFLPTLNRHERHILDISSVPAPISADLSQQARDVAHGIAEGLQLVGVACIEFFATRDGRLLVNEVAPRPHNSGHLTIEAAATSQFEQQVRCLCGLPPGSTANVSPAAMANLLGDLWRDGEPDWERALSVPGVRLHLYGKGRPRPGRKMGHLTACRPTVDEAISAVTRARLLAAGQPA